MWPVRHRPDPTYPAIRPHKLGAAALAAVLAVSAIAGPAHAATPTADRLQRAAHAVCAERGLEPGTAEFEACYQEQLIVLSGKLADSIHGSP